MRLVLTTPGLALWEHGTLGLQVAEQQNAGQHIDLPLQKVSRLDRSNILDRPLGR